MIVLINRIILRKFVTLIMLSVAEAIDNLKTFLESIGEPTTRCSGLDFDNVISIPHRGISTRSANEETPLLYALNFPDDGGCYSCS